MTGATGADPNPEVCESLSTQFSGPVNNESFTVEISGSSWSGFGGMQ